MEKANLSIINPSSGGVQYVARGITVNIPGHRFQTNPLEISLPTDLCVHFKKTMSRRFPHIVVSDVEADAVEGIDTVIDIDAGQDEHIPSEDTTAALDIDTSPTGRLEGGVELPSKDDFFSQCTAKKEANGKWAVTCGTGEFLIVDGVAHHKQAKQAAYDKLYRGVEK